jgi:hypothetical protein
MPMWNLTFAVYCLKNKTTEYYFSKRITMLLTLSESATIKAETFIHIIHICCRKGLTFGFCVAYTVLTK